MKGPSDINAIVADNEARIFDFFRRGVGEAARCLRSERDIDPAMFGRFCARRDELIDDFNARAVAACPTRFKRPVECAAGCAHCCNQHVIISSTEALHIALFVAEPAALRDVVAAAAARINGLDHAARWGITCPLLVDRRCSVYQHRPEGCRTHFSLSRRACAYEKTSPNLSEPKLAGHALFLAFDYALLRLAERPLQMVQGELAGMLQYALAPGAFEAWAEGERIFPDGLFRPYTAEERQARRMSYPEVLRAAARASGADQIIAVEPDHGS